MTIVEAPVEKQRQARRYARGTLSKESWRDAVQTGGFATIKGRKNLEHFRMRTGHT